MARFHVYASLEGGAYLLDVQANLLNHLTTRVVVPLMPVDKSPKPARVLNPSFEIKGVRHVMVTQFLATVPCRIMGEQAVDLQPEAAVIVNALDCLFQGI